MGRRKFNDTLEIARKLVRAGKGKELMPTEVEPSYFSAKRYYELLRPGSIEGNLFNYEGRMKAASKIKVPVLSLFGAKEEFAAMSPGRMLKVLGQKFAHPYSKEMIIPKADHCFCGYEEKVEQVVGNWLNHLMW